MTVFCKYKDRCTGFPFSCACCANNEDEKKNYFRPKPIQFYGNNITTTPRIGESITEPRER